NGTPLMMVLFDQSEITLGPEAANDGIKDPTLAALEDELRRTRDQLRGSLGESAVSNEELRASNEELQASNEELRSTTEELETSKEELQSVNEELVTVNQELKTRIEETVKINDDLKNLLTSTDIATVFVDRGMRIKRFTPRASQLFNLIASDVGRSLLDITHRLDYPALESDAVQVFESLKPIEREIEGEDNKTYLVRVLPYRTEQDVIDGAVLNFVDISATRHAQRQLAVGEANLQRVVESTQDYAIVTLDAKGIVTGWNLGATRLFGFDKDDMVGRPIDSIFSSEDRAAGVPAQERSQARTRGRAEDERWHVTKRGDRVYCSGIMTPLHERGELIGYAKIVRDVSEEKRVEAQLEALLAKEQQAGAELQRAFALKDEFLAVMSHELKHPLNLIHVNAELLSRLPQVRNVPAVAQAAEVIRRTVLSQAKIIDDLLDLSRIRTGKLALKRQRMEWADVIGRARDAIEGDAAGRQITISLELDAAASPVDADPVRAEQIVWNLLSNAIKFSAPGGTIDVRLALDGDFSRLDVKDTGQGISADFVPQVFDMFRQANRPSTRPQGGMGIGLALVRQLAEEHGGKVAAASEGEAMGSTFSVWLPLSRASSTDATSINAPQPLVGLRILVVDDSEDALVSFTALLQLEGAEVTAAGSGADALAAAAEAASFDLILSDIAMPEMDGYVLIAKLRALETTRAVPAVALTGFGRPADVQRALAAGFNAHLGKPVVIDELFDVIRSLRIKRIPVPSGD
ncbi:MAG: PAS domain-containing protein, partial [Burkholderiales bacterium]